MAHTNSTENYHLPQFLGTDKPAWLGDINPAFQAIDTQMKNNADGVTSANTTATQASNKVGNLEDLQTTEKSNTVGAINEINQTASTASSLANTANDNASTAVRNVSELSSTVNKIISAFNFTNKGTFTVKTSGLNVTVTDGTISYALNEDGTVGKIYTNSLVIRNDGSSGNKFIPLTGATVKPTGTDYSINLGKTISPTDTSHNVYLYVDALGKLFIRVSLNNLETTDIFLPPCILFFEDFGDVVES